MRVALSLVACSLVWAVCPAAAEGQEKYELTPDDTWKVVDAIDPSTPAGQLALARQALAEGNTARARKLATRWIKEHPRDPQLPEAYLVRADALMADGSYYKSLFDYEFVARGYPASEVFVIVLQRELEIARLYATGTRRKWLFGFRLLDAGDEAEELFILIQERMPGSRLAEEAGIELANFYFRRRKMDLAVEMYSIFLENNPNSTYVSEARRRLIYAHLATFKGPQFDASGLHEARARLAELIAVEPATAERIGADAIMTRIDESDARKMLLTARWYQRSGDPVAAELIIRRLVERYPRTVAAADALRLIGRILPLLPPIVLAEAPDYGALRQAILGTAPAAGREPAPAGAGKP